MESTHSPAHHPPTPPGQRVAPGPDSSRWGAAARTAQGPQLEDDFQVLRRPSRPLPRPGLAVYSFSERKPWSRKLCRVFPAAMTDTITSQLRSTFRNRLILLVGTNPADKNRAAGTFRYRPHSVTKARPAPAAHATTQHSNWLRARHSRYALL